jgi:hypothetical protein
MTETRDASYRMFELWIGSLDAVKVAAEESFHSHPHREAMTVHEMNRRAVADSLSDWSKKQKKLRDRDQLATIRFGREETFSTTQFQIALDAEERN